MSDYHNKRAAEVIKQILYLTLATSSSDGKPWNSPVARFYDNDLNFYWFSDKQSIHSTNIRNNENVFAVIYDSTMAEGTGEAVYMEGTAHEVNDENEVEQIVSWQSGSMKVSFGQVMGDSIHRFYKFTPLRIWMNDDQKDENGDYIKDIRVEVPIDTLKASLN